jgi:outer membrane murein-binding lipoprotein Lpp
MTGWQKILVLALIAVAAGTEIYEARRAAVLQTQVQTLQRQQTSLSKEIQQLHFENHAAENRQAWQSFTDKTMKPKNVVGIMTDPNFRAVIHALEQRSGFDNLAEPEVVVVSGRRENRMRATDIVLNMISAVPNSPAFTNQSPVK